MKILFVCSAKIWGGNEKWTSMAMGELSKNHDVSLCYKSDDLTDKFGNAISKFKVPIRNYFDIRVYYKLYRYLKKNKIEIIVSTKKREYFICGLLSRFLGIKNVLRLGSVRNLNRPFWHKIVYSTLNDGIIVNAHRIKNNLLKYRYMKQDKIKVIYNGIHQDLTVTGNRKNNDFIITSLGRITKAKGFHLLIKAFSKLPDELKKDTIVQIVGKGAYEDELKCIAKDTGVKNNIHFLGFRENPQEIISSSDLVVLLSDNEGVSNTLLESMVNGIPVLSSNVGGVSEFINHKTNGFIAESMNPYDIAELLSDILKHKDRLPGVGMHGKKTAAEMFSMDKMRLELESFLERVINE